MPLGAIKHSQITTTNLLVWLKPTQIGAGRGGEVVGGCFTYSQKSPKVIYMNEDFEILKSQDGVLRVYLTALPQW